MTLFVISYLCFAVFVIVVSARIYKQVSLPVHFRWELYPVQHEPKEKAAYGGSYMEEVNWWEKNRHKSLANEIRYMAPEILLLRGLREENRRLWSVSFPFHFGLYLLFGTLFLLIVEAILMVFGCKIYPGTGTFSSFLYYLTILTGFLGLVLGLVGVTGLIRKRLTNAELRNYSSPLDYFNLFFFQLFFVVGLLTWLFLDHSFGSARYYLYSLITFGGRPEGSAVDTGVLGTLTVLLGSLLFAYIPLTHMSHMFMKYFMYHNVRWEDTPNLKGSHLEAAILENLGFKPTWISPHIGADGKKTWSEIANPKSKED
jgi:nitrate reductase gamma subunit